MTDVALSILALIGGGLTLELFRAAWSPMTSPNPSGLPLEIPDALEESQTGNPS